MTVKLNGKTYTVPCKPPYFKDGAFVAGAVEMFLKTKNKNLATQYLKIRADRDMAMNKSKFMNLR